MKHNTSARQRNAWKSFHLVWHKESVGFTRYLQKLTIYTPSPCKDQYTFILFSTSKNYQTRISYDKNSPPMRSLIILLSLLALAASACAGIFSLHDKKRWYATGCDLKMSDVTGHCSKTVSVNNVYSCDSLPDSFTHGKACGGWWTLDVKKKDHAARFRGRFGKEMCYLNSLESGSQCSGFKFRDA